MKLSIGPIAYYWHREKVMEFYHWLAGQPVDIVYLGETVCAKRRELGPDDWLTLASMLQRSGKEVVLSSMTLLEAGSEIGTVKRLCQQTNYCIEANDMSAVALLEGRPFVSGPGINIYNDRTLAKLADCGLKRWVLPVELSRDTLADLQAQRPHQVETEVLVYGRLPLAYSARCYTARHYGLPKDACAFRCLDHPDGLLLSTREGQPFLTLNGIQTQSASTCNLLSALADMRELGVDIVRISPQAEHMATVVSAFYGVLQEGLDLAVATERLVAVYPIDVCDGYWHGGAGMDALAAAEAS